MRFAIEEFTRLHMLYCCQVASLGDWNPEYFCEHALVEQREEVLETWGEDPNVWGEAAKLDVDEVEGLQNHLRLLHRDSKWEFRQVIFGLVSLSM